MSVWVFDFFTRCVRSHITWLHHSVLIVVGIGLEEQHGRWQSEETTQVDVHQTGYQVRLAG